MLVHLVRVIIPHLHLRSLEHMRWMIDPSSIGLSDMIMLVNNGDDAKEEGRVKRSHSVAVSCLTVPDGQRTVSLFRG